MNYNKLPADNTATILGVVALILVFLGCCCGFFSVISLVVAIIGLMMANKSLREYKLNPEAFSHSSYSSVNTAKILNIIALIISALITAFYLVYFLIYGALFSTAIMESYKNKNNYYDYNEWENDSIYYEQDNVIIEEDSIVIDSINIKDYE